MTRTRLLLTAGILLCSPLLQAFSQERDTIVVQAFTFADDPTRHAWGNIFEYDGRVAFPEPGGRYEKIVMLYTLKCDARTKADNLACGEWDYSTWTRVWDDSATHWEIGRFITPYGGGLDLGPNGFTWEFDVSDYAPVLTGEKRVTAGNSQELLDLRFLFITGTPTRDPISVTQLWTPGNKNYQKIVEDSILSAISVHLDPEATEYRINTRPQGGNFNGGPNTDNCAEFCDREHSIAIDGVERFRWNVWNECGENPVYPQGGTWIYDRAGWCPGDLVTTQHHELTPFVSPGDTITVDYDIESPPQFTPYGHWVFWADLVAYGPPNFTRDVGIERILAPTENRLHSRFNPWCGGPIVEVVNRGTETVRELSFTWSYDRENEQTWIWSGSIPYLGTARIELPQPDDEFWRADATGLTVELRAVNGTPDEYGANDIAESRITMPDRLPSEVTINLLTNRLAALSTDNYELTLYGSDGSVILRKDDFGVEERTMIPVELAEGCYRLELVNPEGLGLDFWAIRDQLGRGSLSLETADGKTVKTFGADFGNSIVYSFRVPAPQIEPDQSEIDFGPGRVDEPIVRTLRLTPKNPLGVTLYRLVFLSGGSYFKIRDVSPPIADSLPLRYGDTVSVEIAFTPTGEREYLGKMLVTSSDARGVLEVRTRGVGDNTVSSVDPIEVGAAARLELVRSGNRLRWIIRSESAAGSSEHDVRLLDAAGREVYRQTSRYDRGEFSLEALPAGSYFLRITDGVRVLEEKISVAR